MSTEPFTDLMQRELDGANSAAESAELHTRMNADPDLKADYDRMREIVRAMEADGFHDTPDGHVERVAMSIPFRSRRGLAAPPAGPGWFGWLRGVYARPALRFAGVFGVGLVAGALVWSSVAKHPSGLPFDHTLDISWISGTMKSAAGVPGYAPAGELNIQLDGVEGTIQLLQNDSHESLLAEVELHTDSPIEWELEYAAGAADLAGFRRFSGNGGNLVATDSPTRSHTRTSHEGDGTYLLLFSTPERLTTPMTVRIFSADGLLFEDVITEADSR